MRFRSEPLARGAAVAAASFLSGRLALLLAIPPGYVSAVWPPAGVSLAAVLLYGPGIWPAVFLGSFLTHVPLTSGSQFGGPGADAASIAALIAAGATLQALVAASILRRLSVKFMR